jgi:dolichyl-phosphate beta-glucosyltransferase
MDFSIVIPAFREASKIGRDVEAAGAFLAEAGMVGQIIVVDDGSPDDTAAQAQAAPVPPGVHREVLRYERNRGKGYAIRTGMRQARGEYVMFADSGLCVAFDFCLRGLELLKAGQCELAHGTRKARGSIIRVAQPLHRRIGSRVFRLLMSLMGVPGRITDTQCGFKMYVGDAARELYGECITDGFMFDAEIILRALRKGYRIREFPVQWYHDRDSRLRPFQTAFRMLLELWRIRKALAKG